MKYYKDLSKISTSVLFGQLKKMEQIDRLYWEDVEYWNKIESELEKRKNREDIKYDKSAFENIC
jgi:homoserine trans-succinylase